MLKFQPAFELLPVYIYIYSRMPKHRDSDASLLSKCHLSHACHVPYFQTGTLSHACHVTKLFKCELPVDYVGPHHICISIILREAILPCFPQYNCAHQNLTEKLCLQLHGGRSRPAPAPLRTQRLTPLAFATPCTQIDCENTGFGRFLTFRLPHCPTPATLLTFKLAHCPTPAT